MGNIANVLANAMAKILAESLTKIVTYKFVTRVFMMLAKKISKSTRNTFDDDLCKATGDALGNPCD